MTHADICASVQRLKKRFDETDPFRLCKAMDILLLSESMGLHDNAIKGFYMKCKRIRAITINSDLPEVVQKVIVAHELGHATIHQDSGICTFHDISLFEQISDLEREANLFAAELLLEDQTVLNTLNQNITFFHAASVLMVPQEMLDFKLRLMKSKGYPLTEVPIQARNDFMRQMKIPLTSDYCN